MAVLPKLCVSEVVAHLKEKNALMFYDGQLELRLKYANWHFGARGYYVATIGNANKETIRQYIKEQEKNAKPEDGMK